MSKVWKILALLLVITALVWLTTMWRWQSAHVDPTPGDLALNLALLPLVLTAALVGTLWSVKRLRGYAASPVTAPAPTRAATPSADSGAHTAAAERSASVRVLAAAVQVQAGATWAEARTAVAEGDCKPGLDAELRDADGIAVFTAPKKDLATDTVADAVNELLAERARSQPEVWAGREAPTDMLRALALLEPTVAALQESLAAQWPALSAPSALPRGAASAPLQLPTASIRVGIPARWSATTQQLAGDWLEQLLAPHIDAGLKAAGQSRAMASNARPAVQLHVHASESAESFWQLMEQQLQQWQRDKAPGLLWVLAADSLVSEEIVEAMASSGELFAGRHQQGRVPGEAAAALLLASEAWAVPPEAPPALARLHKASLARRDKSADATGRITPQTLMQALGDTLKGHGLEATSLQHLTTDGDHRASRTGELYETTQELLPHLDANEHAMRLGLGCGDVGVARLLACTALAATQTAAAEAPGLVLGTLSPYDRLVALVTPAAPPEQPAAAALAQAA